MFLRALRLARATVSLVAIPAFTTDGRGPPRPSRTTRGRWFGRKGLDTLSPVVGFNPSLYVNPRATRDGSASAVFISNGIRAHFVRCGVPISDKRRAERSSASVGTGYRPVRASATATG